MIFILTKIRGGVVVHQVYFLGGQFIDLKIRSTAIVGINRRDRVNIKRQQFLPFDFKAFVLEYILEITNITLLAGVSNANINLFLRLKSL